MARLHEIMHSPTCRNICAQRTWTMLRRPSQASNSTVRTAAQSHLRHPSGAPAAQNPKDEHRSVHRTFYPHRRTPEEIRTLAVSRILDQRRARGSRLAFLRLRNIAALTCRSVSCCRDHGTARSIQGHCAPYLKRRSLATINVPDTQQTPIQLHKVEHTQTNLTLPDPCRSHDGRDWQLYHYARAPLNYG
ncbi:hypothetical protein OE88DRAFT_1667045 [Heliocybe sulcata]|uniref:Uncharacterized protein n=1 Tax=Heliocybe sulcata TaxID=5364 RepID=A0A5C3MNF4_9AGAM|nr:hypothetical protein OE88DRAFT_1667045 [Heliocybe sulcata]